MSQAMSQGIGTGIAPDLPRYDPLDDGDGRRSRWVLTGLSVAVHLGLLALFWNVILGAVVEEEQVVTVRMLEPQPEKKQPPKLRRKVLAQRVLDASVRRRSEHATPEVVRKSEIRKLESVQRVKLDRTEVTRAPRKLTERSVQTRKLDVFSERQIAEPVKLPRPTEAKVTRVQSTEATSGPRTFKAAAPTTAPDAVDVQAPTVARGVISDNAVEGDVQGARIADIETGDASRTLEGARSGGALIGQAKNCNTDPTCQAYLEEIRKRVYARWLVPLSVGSGTVRLEFLLDAGGSVHDVALVSRTDEQLGLTARTAFQHAAPFPPPPPQIRYIVGRRLTLTFHTNEVSR